MPRPQPRPGPVPRAWQAQLRDAVRDIEELTALLGLPPGSLAAGRDAAVAFPLLVPRGFIARMRRGDALDPLLLQVLPRAPETQPDPACSDDPLDEQRLARAGVIRKYPGRALLVTTAACPVHCRYCFRREFPYDAHVAARDDWQGAIDALSEAADVDELILSGGDPLSLSDRKLGNVFARLASVDHIRTVRLHTRFPIMIPERVTPALARLLLDAPFRTVVVVHVNHPNEIDAGVAAALGALKASATGLLNQAVLLRGINDDVATLARLSERLFDSGALPYYLHALDRVTGAGHFAVADATAVALVRALRSRLPGYLVPRLVREIPGRLSKTPLDIQSGLLRV